MGDLLRLANLVEVVHSLVEDGHPEDKNVLGGWTEEGETLSRTFPSYLSRSLDIFKKCVFCILLMDFFSCDFFLSYFLLSE